MKGNCGLQKRPAGHLADVFRGLAAAFFSLSDAAPSGSLPD